MEAQQHPKHLKLQLISKLYTHKYLHYSAYECFKNINAGYQMDAMQIKSQFALIEFVYLDAGKNISHHSVADLNSFLRGGMQDDNALFSKYVLSVIGERGYLLECPNCSFSTQ